MKLSVDDGGKETVVDLGVTDRPTKLEAPTAEQAGAGEIVLSDRELNDAKRHNLLKETPKAPTPEEAAAKAESEKAAKAAADKVAADKKKAEDLAAGKTPPADPKVTKQGEDAVRELLEENPTPEREAEVLKEWTKNEKALYWGRKKAVGRAQRAEKTVQERDTEIAELRKQLAAKGDDLAADPFADPKSPEAIAAKKKADADAAAAGAKPTEAQLAERRTEVNRVLNQQEADFVTVHPDFKDAFNLTQDIIDRAEESDEKLAELFPSALERRGVRSLLRDFFTSTAVPDHPKLKKLAPELAYEIAGLHPKRQNPDNGGKPIEAPAAIPPKVAKAEEPPPSSGSVSGGGNADAKRIIDMTQEDYLELSDDQARSLQSRYPKEFAALQRRLG